MKAIKFWACFEFFSILINKKSDDNKSTSTSDVSTMMQMIKMKNLVDKPTEEHVIPTTEDLDIIVERHLGGGGAGILGHCVNTLTFLFLFCFVLGTHLNTISTDISVNLSSRNPDGLSRAQSWIIFIVAILL